MTANPPTPEQARASLEAIADARRGVADATAQPLWMDLGYALVIGVGIGLIAAGNVIWGLAVGTVGYGIVFLERRASRGHGQADDSRATVQRGLLIFGLWTGLSALSLILEPRELPWYPILMGGLGGLGLLALLRWKERVRAHRVRVGGQVRT